MSIQTTPGISRRTWRTALIVFLVVFLGGSGVSGAYALWSKQATVTAAVTTGYWVQPGFDLGLSVAASRARDKDTPKLVGVELSWAPAPNQKPPQGVEVTYKVEGRGLGKGLGALDPTRIESGLPYAGTQPNLKIQITRPIIISERFEVTITPYIDGIAGKSSTHEFRYTTNGAIQEQ